MNTPTFLSSLMQVPIISRALKPSQKVGIICASGRILSSAPALRNCGVDDLSCVVIAGAEDLPAMQNVIQNTGHLNNAKLAEELATLAKQTVNENPDIGAILLECTEMSPGKPALLFLPRQQPGEVRIKSRIASADRLPAL